MAKSSRLHRSRSTAGDETTMDQQILMGTSLREMGPPNSQMRSAMESLGIDHSEALKRGACVPLLYAYKSIPHPPVSPAAPLASAAAARSPADGVDRISRLPDQILRNIVARLPAKDAARTAALASRWRGIWLSVPLSVVDDQIVPKRINPQRVAPGGEDILSVVVVLRTSRVLAAHPGPFRCVNITRGHMAAHQPEIEQWLKLLAANGVQELVFMNRPWPMDLPLPATIFSCGASLTRLHLGVWRFPETRSLPRAAGFPNLKELVLSNILIRDRDLAFLLDRSPVLENLTVIGAQTELRLRVVHRNIRCLQLGFCGLEDISVVDAPRLEKFFMWMIHNNGNYPRIKIGHAPNLRMLGFWQPGNQELQVGSNIIKADTKVGTSTVVASVHVLALEVHFEIRNEAKMVPCFLKCFPNVQTLHVYSMNMDDPTGKLNLKFWKEAGHIECVQRHVRKFVFHEFRGKKSEIAFLQFIAEKAQVLENMVVMVASKCFSSVDDVNKKLKPLTSAEWASKEYKLIIFKSPSSDGASAPWNFRSASDFPRRDPFDLLTAHAELNRDASVHHCCNTL